jgi:hypothetical protein
MMFPTVRNAGFALHMRNPKTIIRKMRISRRKLLTDIDSTSLF